MGAAEVGVISVATMEASEREGDMETRAGDDVEETCGLDEEGGGVPAEEEDVVTGREKLGIL